MEILFRSAKLANTCNDPKEAKKTHGAERAKKLARRLDDLRAADNLEAMRNLPGRCHELKGNRKGELALDLDGPFRLMFAPTDDPAPIKPDGGLDWAKVRRITVLEVGDYHGE